MINFEVILQYATVLTQSDHSSHTIYIYIYIYILPGLKYIPIGPILIESLSD